MNEQQFLKIIRPYVKSYQASADVLKSLEDVQLVATVGPSGAGKTTLMRGSGWPMVVSHTTRTIRPGEQANIDFFFRTDFEQLRKEFEQRKFVQVAIGPAGNFYATSRDSFPKEGVCTAAIVAEVIPKLRTLGFGQFKSVYVVPPSYDEWHRRLEARSTESPEQTMKRLKEAARSLQMALEDRHYTFLLNDHLTIAIQDLIDIGNGSYNHAKSTSARYKAQELLNELNRRFIV